MVDRLVMWLSEINPQTESENLVIRYGAAVLLDNCLKLFILLIVGVAVGKGSETVAFLIVFCSLRIQAGGYHAKTGWGCGLCMVLVWLIGMIGSELVELSLPEILGLFVIETFIILWKAPKTVNQDCYTYMELRERKMKAIVIAALSMAFAVCSKEWRTLLACAVALETITLLPQSERRTIL